MYKITIILSDHDPLYIKTIIVIYVLSMYCSDQKDNEIQIYRFIHTTSLLTRNALALASSAVSFSSALGSRGSLFGPSLPLLKSSDIFGA